MKSSKKNHAKLILATLLILLLCAPLASTATARAGDGETQAPEKDPAPADDDPTLYATEGGENPMLIQGNDDAQDKAANDSSTTAPEDADTENEQSLIAPLSQPDNTAALVGAAVLFSALAVILVVAVVLHSKKQP